MNLLGQSKIPKPGQRVKKSYQILKKAIDPIGAKAVASKLKISTALVYKWCEDRDNGEQAALSGAANPLDRLRAVYELTGDVELINWLCQAADGYYVSNPSIEKAKPDIKVMKNIHDIIRGFSETLEAISKSYNDKNITIKESSRIREEWEGLKRIAEGFVRACESGKFDKPK